MYQVGIGIPIRKIWLIFGHTVKRPVHGDHDLLTHFDLGYRADVSRGTGNLPANFGASVCDSEGA